MPAQTIIDFIGNLPHSAGPAAGQPFILRDWQREIIEQIYGPKHPDGRRIVRTAFLTLPRKNGKTILAAGHWQGSRGPDRKTCSTRCRVAKWRR